MKNNIRIILSYLFILGFITTAVIYNIHKPIILVVHSYNSDYSWTRDVNEGIKKFLVSTGYYNVRWHYMDTKNNPSEAHKNRAGLLARRVIDEIKPNILLAVDDDAQEYVAKYYIDHPEIKIVFSGVNATPEAYGFEDGQNTTGVLERIPLKALKDTLEVIKNNTPGIKDIRILHLSDDSNTVLADDEFIHNFPDWGEVKVLPSVLVHSYRDWKKAVAQAPNEVNFLIISNYRKVYDDSGKLVPPTEVVKWTVDNSKIPVIGLNGFTVEDGARFAVATSPFEQGEIAAKMVTQILNDKKQPKDIPITQTRQFIIYMRGKFDMKLPAIYEAFARAANKYWDK